MSLKDIYNTYKIEITGVIAWIFFSFATVRFIPIYINTKLAHLLTYNICSLLFLAYFFMYYRTEFSTKKFLILILIFNLGFSFLNNTYQWLVYLRKFEFDIETIVATIFINFLLWFPIYFITNQIIKRNRK